jgi:hypothetical protein
VWICLCYIVCRQEDTCCICKWLYITIAEHDNDMIILLGSEHRTVRSMRLGGCSKVDSLNIVDYRSLILGLHVLAMPFVCFWKPNNVVAMVHQVSISIAVGTFKWLTWRYVGGLLVEWQQHRGLLHLYCVRVCPHISMTSHIHLPLMLENMNSSCVKEQTHHQNRASYSWVWVVQSHKKLHSSFIFFLFSQSSQACISASKWVMEKC